MTGVHRLAAVLRWLGRISGALAAMAGVMILLRTWGQPDMVIIGFGAIIVGAIAWGLFSASAWVLEGTSTAE
jgi:hypothetical protein